MNKLIKFVEGALSQTAVYWGNPQNDGFATEVYDAPIEIPCRWEGKAQYVKGWDAKGNVIEYIGIIYVKQDLDENGCLFLGTLNDLTGEAYESPKSMDEVYIIKQFEKLPVLKSNTEFLRRAFLSLYQYR